MHFRLAKAILFLAAIFLLAGGTYYWRFVSEIPVRTATPEQNVEVRVFGIGTIEAQIVSKVGFQIAGRLVAIETDQGDFIRTGAVLARLDDQAQRPKLAKREGGAAEGRGKPRQGPGTARAGASRLRTEAQCERPAADFGRSRHRLPGSGRGCAGCRGNCTDGCQSCFCPGERVMHAALAKDASRSSFSADRWRCQPIRPGSYWPGRAQHRVSGCRGRRRRSRPTCE
jgi:hypothetical protein